MAGSLSRAPDGSVLRTRTSGYFYAEGFLNEDINSWLNGHIHAYAFFGGVPQFTIPDNCSTAVDRRHFDERGILNTKYVEFLNHYGTVPKPTRVRRPKDKGHVERHVGIVDAFCAARRSLMRYQRSDGVPAVGPRSGLLASCDCHVVVFCHPLEKRV